MGDLKKFRETVRRYYRQKTNRDGRRYTQLELASEIGLHENELSKRLQKYRDRKTGRVWLLTSDDVLAIVRTLAKWGAIVSQQQAKELLEMMEYPHRDTVDWSEDPFRYLRSAPLRSTSLQVTKHFTDVPPQKERLARLRAIQVEHTVFLRDRLESFVGRQSELAELHNHIQAMLPTGGYITINGKAGQGKSSIIAKLIDEYGRENVAHHFIPLNPGPDYQVTLLRDLMARLILKHNLPDLYIASESRTVLRDYFQKLLAEIAAEGKQEVIFIDGLDQLLEEPYYGERDLSFLPSSPPTGIVLVLGTRPNDTLHPLERCKPCQVYALPNFHRSDFDLILEHRGVKLNALLTDQFYRAMQENALYLDLVAKVLAQADAVTPEEIIRRVSDNPDSIFSISVVRLKRNKQEWYTLLKPILGLLLVAQAPFNKHHIKQILEKDDEQVSDALIFLGGLISHDGQGHYYLYHLKLQEYLRREVIVRDEEEGYHRTLAHWCELTDMSSVWKDLMQDSLQQEHREYVRRHYITHLYRAREWEHLFGILDEGSYGQAKMRYDSTTGSYVQDLDLGRDATAAEGWTIDEGIRHLPLLWRYSLLRCSLASRADTYTEEAFEALLLLKRVQEALDLAELLTEPDYKVKILLLLAEHFLEEATKEQEAVQLLLRCHEVTVSVEAHDKRVIALCCIGRGFAQVRRLKQANAVWSEAEVAALNIKDEADRARMLERLALTLAQARQWEQAKRVAKTIEEHWVKVEALGSLGTILAEEKQWEQANATWAEAEVEAQPITEDDGKADAFHELALIYIEAKQWERTEALLLKTEESREKDESRLELSLALAEEQQWRYAEEVVWRIESKEIKADALSQLGEMLSSAQSREQAKALLVEAQVMIQALEESQEEQASQFSYAKARVLLRSQRWTEVLTLTQTLDDDNERIWILRDLGNAIIKAHKWDQIDDVIHMIEQSENYEERVDEALYVLSSAFAEERQWERAQSIIHLIEGRQGKAGALLDLGIALAGAHQLQRAQAVWGEVLALVPIWEDYGERAEILLDLGMMLAKTSQLEQAQVHWKEAERMASLIEDDQEKSHILCKIGAILNAAQQRERAEAVWSQAEAAAHAIEREEERDQALWFLSITLAFAHRWGRAEAVAHSIAENKKRAQALHTLIAVLSHMQQEEKAEAIAADWLNLVSSLEKDDMIYTIGQEFVQAHLWERAVAMVNLMENTWQRMHLLGQLVEELARERQWEHAEAIISNMKEGKERAKALSMLGMMLSLTQEQEQAEAKWVEAEIMTSGLRDSWEKDNALSHILQDMGLALAQTRQWERAEIVANRMAENRDRADVVREIQESLEDSREHERSLRLLQRSWRQASRKDYLFKLFPLAHVFIADNPEIGYAFFDSFTWVDSILKEIR